MNRNERQVQPRWAAALSNYPWGTLLTLLVACGFCVLLRFLITRLVAT